VKLRTALRGFEDRARTMSPRRRRWDKFLRTLPIDPDQLAAPLVAPAEGDFIICGCPRTGTSLVNAILYQPPAVVTVMEPWDGMRMLPADLFASLRNEIVNTGRLTRGRLDVDALISEGSVRWCQEARTSHTIQPDGNYCLGVKWPAFWRYLELLPNSKFVVCLRHPIEVIHSFKRAGGRLALGLNYDTAFNRSMNEYLLMVTDDVALRRVLLFDYIHSKLLPHLTRTNVFVVRYERWFTEREALTAELGTFLNVKLQVGRPTIQHPKSEPRLDPYEMALLSEHCTTAHHLGYSLAEKAR
jgi:hypothetical protein